MSPRAEELLQHEVVGVLPLIKKHGRCEAHWADEESQPARQKKTNKKVLYITYVCNAYSTNMPGKP